MKATTFEYRFRFAIHGLVFALGFWAPWNYAVHLDSPGPNAHLWGVLAAVLAKTGVANIQITFEALLILGIVFAVLAACLRTWGAAYLGSAVVKDGSLRGNAVVADGPYRYVRNPLYLGTWLHALALALLMPPSGAVFVLVVIGLLQLRLISAEEPFLEAQLGDAYITYKAKVRSLIPSLRPRIAGSGAQAAWGQAILGEIYFWGVAGSFAIAGWRYNAFLLTQCVIVSLGVSLMTRALVPKK